MQGGVEDAVGMHVLKRGRTCATAGKESPYGYKSTKGVINYVRMYDILTAEREYVTFRLLVRIYCISTYMRI